MAKPLEGVVVLDMTRVLAGPYATMMLADLGARVIKVERPGVGDDSRIFGPFKNDKSAYYVSLNREKESIAVDLKKPEGVELIKRFVKKADVICENFRPGTMEKLGLGYDVLKEINPKIIYAATSGYGHTGPWSKKPCYDMVAQAAGGIMSITGQPDGTPTRVGASIGDILSGIFTCNGITAALYRREVTGEGTKIDVSMVDCQVAILENALVRYQIEGVVPKPLGARHGTIVPFQAFKTKDSWIIIPVGNEKMWKNLCIAVKREDLTEDEKFYCNKVRVENKDELIPIFEEIFLTDTTENWIKVLEANNFPCTPICNVADVMSNPQLLAREMFVKTEYPEIGEITVAGNPIKMSCFEETGVRGPAPTIGQHTDAVLTEVLGYSEEEVKKLREAEAIV
jgi:CoA:oxalate CoA-transferase